MYELGITRNSPKLFRTAAAPRPLAGLFRALFGIFWRVIAGEGHAALALVDVNLPGEWIGVVANRGHGSCLVARALGTDRGRWQGLGFHRKAILAGVNSQIKIITAAQQQFRVF